MLKGFKKLVSLVLVLAVSMAISIPCFAQKVTNGQLQKSEEARLEQLSENYALSHIKNNVSHFSNPTWTLKTEIADTIKTYNVKDKINGFIFNLQTNGIPSGYIVTSLVDDKPIILQYGYNGNYMVEQQEITSSAFEGKKIISVGEIETLFEKNDDGSYLSISDKKTSVKENEVSLLDSQQKERIKKQLDDSLRVNGQIVYKDVNIKGLWNFTPYTMDDFDGYDNHCTPTGGINLLAYWKEIRNVSPLFVDDDVYASFDYLANEMQHDNNVGTYTDKAFNGMLSYISKNHLKRVAGKDYRDLRTAFSNTADRWHWLSLNLSGSIPYTLSSELDHYDGRTESNHTFLAVGYQTTSTGDYIRVINEWEKDRSDFINFSAWEHDLYNAWYVRW